MADERHGAEESQAGRATRYKVGAGEDFPLADEETQGRMDMRVEWNCDGGWRRDAYRRGDRRFYPLPRLVYVLAATAGFIALISLAVSYPLATLGAIVVLFLLAGGPRRRRSFDYRDWDGPRRRRRDAA